ncbi:MAG TPA: hypothetical protein DF383_13240 [Deltaproteobacteria bacterium]|nr:hypothetical protein [Deltaproteobacteria bacterium]
MKCPFCGNENLAGADECDSCGEDLTAFDGVRPGTRLEKSLVKDSLEILHGAVPLRVSPETPLREIAEHLARENRAILVMEGERLLGIVTERDLLCKIPEDARNWADWPVSRLMTSEPETLEFSDKIAYALHKMSIGGFRHIPLLRNGYPERVIGVRDLLEYLAEMFPC